MKWLTRWEGEVTTHHSSWWKGWEANIASAHWAEDLVRRFGKED